MAAVQSNVQRSATLRTHRARYTRSRGLAVSGELQSCPLIRSYLFVTIEFSKIMREDHPEPRAGDPATRSVLALQREH